jgi:hypothetical protein
MRKTTFYNGQGCLSRAYSGGAVESEALRGKVLRHVATLWRILFQNLRQNWRRQQE